MTFQDHGFRHLCGNGEAEPGKHTPESWLTPHGRRALEMELKWERHVHEARGLRHQIFICQMAETSRWRLCLFLQLRNDSTG